jgi:hypothetical protein
LQTALYVIGAILIYAAVLMRGQRAEDHEAELSAAERDRRIAQFWDMSTEPEDERIAELKAEYKGDHWQRLKRAAQFWPLIIGGVILILIAHYGFGSGDPTLTGTFVVLIAGLSWVHYSLSKSIEKLEREIGWLNMMLKVVKDDRAYQRAIAQFAFGVAPTFVGGTA